MSSDKSEAMASLKKTANPAKKIARPKRTKKRELTISEQIDAFLKAGGTIERIPSGVSGQPSLACRRSMTISEKAPEKPQAKTA